MVRLKHPKNKAERLNAAEKKERARQLKEERASRVRKKIIKEELKVQDLAFEVAAARSGLQETKDEIASLQLL